MPTAQSQVDGIPYRGLDPEHLDPMGRDLLLLAELCGMRRGAPTEPKAREKYFANIRKNLMKSRKLTEKQLASHIETYRKTDGPGAVRRIWTEMERVS